MSLSNVVFPFPGSDIIKVFLNMLFLYIFSYKSFAHPIISFADLKFKYDTLFIYLISLFS